jgi:hypothetical protein
LEGSTLKTQAVWEPARRFAGKPRGAFDRETQKIAEIFPIFPIKGKQDKRRGAISFDLN